MTSNVMTIFNYIEEYYRLYISTDFQHYKVANNNYNILHSILPNDYMSIISKYNQFKLGTFLFGIFEKSNCRIYGPYIEIAKSYYGSGLYATWNYYINDGSIGKRIDDSPQRTNNFVANNYNSFTDMLNDFSKNIHKYDIKNGSIRTTVHNLPLN
jgi:hypothetical protein